MEMNYEAAQIMKMSTAFLLRGS